MELKPGLSAIVTGGASGIGKALVLALAKKGVFVTIIDFSEEKGRETASVAGEACAKLHYALEFPPVTFIKCDVTNSRDLAAAFEKHIAVFNGLDICINSAGMGDSTPFHKDQTDGTNTWRRVVNVNLISVIDCTRLAIQIMQAARKPGVIINVGSASGLYPMYQSPIYSGSKGGVVLFTRSLVSFKRQGIRINVLCPEFVQTDLTNLVKPEFIDLMGGYLPMEEVVKGAFELISDESKAGSCLWITNRRGKEYWPSPQEEAKFRLPASKLRRNSSPVPLDFQIPQSFEKMVVHTLSHKFRSATSIVRVPFSLPIKSDHVLLKIIYAGVNASDVNFSSGSYFSGSKEDIASRLPFDAGFEAVGIIAAIGDSVKHLKVGTPAAIMTFGSYAEFTVVHSKHILPVPRPDPEVVAMLTSGLTASIALDKAALMDSGKLVLVTAAAGGTGQFAVQLAKLAGNTVVATCGGSEKANLLRDLGVDRVIDYRREDVKAVLKKEFPKGIDIIYESVGGDMFNICLNALAVYGRLVVIGMISQYQGEHGWKPLNYTGLCEKILAKSQTVVCWVFLGAICSSLARALRQVLFSAGKLKIAIDPKRFVGVESVADAVEHLHSGKSSGKVVVCIDPKYAEPLAKL